MKKFIQIEKDTWINTDIIEKVYKHNDKAYNLDIKEGDITLSVIVEGEYVKNITKLLIYGE